MDQATTPTLPANASAITRLRTAVHALKVLSKDPANPYYGPLLNVCLDSATYAKLAKTWRVKAAGNQLLDQRPTLQGRELDLEALGRLPEGTLGHEFVRYFRNNGIAPFVTSFPIVSDVDYLSKRYRETHDLFHVITGYATDEPGEMELQAFVFGNLGLHQTLMILAYSIVRRLQQEGINGSAAYLGRLHAAYLRGRHSRELLSVSYEKLWEQPVSVLAELLCAPA